MCLSYFYFVLSKNFLGEIVEVLYFKRLMIETFCEIGRTCSWRHWRIRWSHDVIYYRTSRHHCQTCSQPWSNQSTWKVHYRSYLRIGWLPSRKSRGWRGWLFRFCHVPEQNDVINKRNCPNSTRYCNQILQVTAKLIF